MKKKLLAGLVGLVITLTLVLSCTPAQRQTARDVRDVVLPLKTLGCVMGSLITDARELARICGAADELVPAIDNLIGVRDAGRRAGVVWRVTADAGVIDAGAPDAADRSAR